MWGNLGVSLLGFTGAIYVLDPLGTGTLALSFGAGVLALVVGTILGTLAVSVAAAPGAETGAPAMVLLRGLFGARLSFLPTVLNIVQLVGWTTFELVTISTALQQVVHGVPRWVWVVAGGVVTTAWRCGRSAGSGCCAATSPSPSWWPWSTSRSSCCGIPLHTGTGPGTGSGSPSTRRQRRRVVGAGGGRLLAAQPRCGTP